MPADAGAVTRARLSVATKSVYGLGDHTVNLVLSAASLLYLFFLTEFGGLRPALAGLVTLIARGVDAFIGPLMGRLSDADTFAVRAPARLLPARRGRRSARSSR